MEDLKAAMKIALANTFVMYAKAHTFHWNVEGPNFSQYHGFLGDLYDELFDAVDPIAEHIRALDGYAPYSLMDLYSAKTIIEEDSVVTRGDQIFGSLLVANNIVIDSLNTAYKLANSYDQNGLSNYLQDRLDIHAKHGWQIRSFLK